LLALWHLHESLPSQLVVVLVGGVQVNAALKNWDQFIRGEFIELPQGVWLSVFNKSGTTSLLLSHLFEVEDGELASVNHLVGDLDEQLGHSLVGVVVPGDGVDHLDAVHQSWEHLLDGFGVSVVQWVDELLKCLQVLDIILGLVEELSHSEVEVSPLGDLKEHVVLALSLDVGVAVGSEGQDVENVVAVLALELLSNSCQSSHLLLPVLELLLWVLLVLAGRDFFEAVNGSSDLSVPVLEEFKELVSHVLSWWNILLEAVLDLRFERGWVLLESDVLTQTVQSLSELFGESSELVGEFLLLLIGDLVAPVAVVHLLNHWLVDVVDQEVQGVDGMFGDLSKDNISALVEADVDWLALTSGSDEVASLALELDLLSVRDEEFSVALMVVLDLTGLIVDLVDTLVVDEDSVWASALEEVFESLLVVSVTEQLGNVVDLCFLEDLFDLIDHPLSSLGVYVLSHIVQTKVV
jgi:hypothetical protein